MITKNSVPPHIWELFKDWQEKIDFADFSEYVCQNCGLKVNSSTQWVRGKTLCRGCYDRLVSNGERNLVDNSGVSNDMDSDPTQGSPGF